MNRTILFFLATMLLVVGGASFVLAYRHFRETKIQLAELERIALEKEAQEKLAGPPLTSFQLIDTTRHAFDSSSLQGKVWVTSFFFSTCPASCVKQNLQVATLQRKFGPRGVQFVSITCDPETDTPGVLSAYAARFNANTRQWKFLTGKMSYITRVGVDIFQVPVAKQGHSENLILIDQQGKLRGYYHWNDANEILALERKISGLLDGSVGPLEEKESEKENDAADDQGKISPEQVAN